MIFRIPSPGGNLDPARVDFVEAGGKYIRRVRDVYDARAHWHRRLYRLSGILVILVGASLPLLTTLTFAHKNLAISLVGVLVAALTSLRAFYRWDRTWVLLRITEFAITDAYCEWLAAIGGKTDPADEATAQVHRKATLDMLDKVSQIRRGEASSYFKDLPFPDSKH